MRGTPAGTLQPRTHGSTFVGNPVAAAVARIVVRKLRYLELLANIERQGERLRKRLVPLHNEIGFIFEVRGKGLMIGAVLRGEWVGRAVDLGEVCRRHGVLVFQAGPTLFGSSPHSTSPTQISATAWTASRPRCGKRWAGRASGRLWRGEIGGFLLRLECALLAGLRRVDAGGEWHCKCVHKDRSVTRPSRRGRLREAVLK